MKFKALFREFRLTPKKRVEVVEPKSGKYWLSHGLSEYFGTLFLACAIAFLTIIVNGKKDIAHYFGNFMFVCLYAGLVILPIALIACLRWSCDLNPSVTVTRMLNGTNTVRYGLFKLAIQVLAGITAGLLVYAFGGLNGSAIHNNGIQARSFTKSGVFTIPFGAHSSHDIRNLIGFFWIAFGELIGTMILISCVFTPHYSEKHKIWFISWIIGMAVGFGFTGGVTTLNPAVALGKEVPGLFFGHNAGHADATSDLVMGALGLWTGELLAPFAYLFFSTFLIDVWTPKVMKAVEFKNNNELHFVNRSKSPNKITKIPTKTIKDQYK